MSATPEQISEAMQDAWNDWVSDTGHIPDAFHIHGPATTQVSADFSRGNFAGHVAAWLETIEARASEAQKETPDART